MAWNKDAFAAVTTIAEGTAPRAREIVRKIYFTVQDSIIQARQLAVEAGRSFARHGRIRHAYRATGKLNAPTVHCAKTIETAHEPERTSCSPFTLTLLLS
ncbi:hypothetical protein PTKU46_91100 [Paraburkholderia terrae]|uniref:hypothetical protein n=1 Tax=Paraburkholderia terrae TaxID=311230 RepID=UPI0030E40687